MKGEGEGVGQGGGPLAPYYGGVHALEDYPKSPAVVRRWTTWCGAAPRNGNALARTLRGTR